VSESVEATAPDSTLFEAIVVAVAAADPEAVLPAVRSAVSAVAATHRRQRLVARALTHRPDVLRDGRPPAPQVLGDLLFILRRTGAAAVAAPSCGECGRALTSVRGKVWLCHRCAGATRVCAGCGTRRPDVVRDQAGVRYCRRCRPRARELDWAPLVAAVRDLDPQADPALVLALAHQAAPRTAQQRALITAVADNPALLHRDTTAAPVLSVLRLIDALADAGVAGVIRPECPRCGRRAALLQFHDGVRICKPCDRRVRAVPCARCGHRREPSTRDPDGQPLCANCHTSDPANAEPCQRCGRYRPVSTRTAAGPICASCHTPPEAACSLCGRTAPCKASTLTGLPRCRSCSGRRVRCRGCGRVRQPHSGTLAEPRCALCTVPDPDTEPPRWHHCPTCHRRGPAAGACAHCRLGTTLRVLLTVEGRVRPELLPLLAWWQSVDRPANVRQWLTHRPAAQTLLRGLADGTIPVSHTGLDQLEDNKTVGHLRRVLVASGVLPERDEHLHRLERWLRNTIDDIPDPANRRIVYRYAHWHHLRRLRARTTTTAKPVSAGQAKQLRNHVTAAAAILDTLGKAGRTLAELGHADIDQWLANRQIARRAELGAFLRWARRERLTTVAVAVRQWGGPRDSVDHDQRWTHARRLLHDDTLATEDRVAGLLLVLYAQPASRINTLRHDQLQVAPDGMRLVFGTTPIDLPKPLVALMTTLASDRAGTERAASPWLFPGRPWTQPISATQLQRRLAAIGIPTRATRTAALIQLAIQLPAAVLARCLGIDISSAVAWQRATSGDWHQYAGRLGLPEDDSVTIRA
jgi:hypothetical protein